jgi:hypothetical protein
VSESVLACSGPILIFYLEVRIRMSNKIQKTIEINAKVKASLEGMEKTVGELERGLEKQKFDLNKNSGLSKLIKDYKAAKAELDELMSGDVIARTDIKKAE